MVVYKLFSNIYLLLVQLPVLEPVMIPPSFQQQTKKTISGVDSNPNHALPVSLHVGVDVTHLLRKL